MIIAVANHKGGVGKTTSTISLGGLLAQTGACLMIDLDPQGNLTTGLGVDLAPGQPSGYDLFTGQRPLPETVTQTPAGLNLVPADVNLVRAESEMQHKSGCYYTLKDRLITAGRTYEHILIDCPPSRGWLTLNALVAADQVLIPVQCQFFALKGLAALLETIQSVQQRLNPRLRILGVLPTMAEVHTIMTQDVLNALKSRGDLPIFPPVPKSVKFAESNLAGEPIHRYAPEPRLLHAYETVAAALVA